MNRVLTLSELLQNPGQVTSTACLRTGESVSFRLLQRDDAQRLGRYFTGLSQATIARFGPHEFTYDMAAELCNRIGQETILRMVVLTGNAGEEAEIIGYFLLGCAVGRGDQERYRRYGISLDPLTDCEFAPSMADAYQNSGAGGVIFAKVAAVARLLGFRRMILMGGVYTTNGGAIRYYEKNGFHKMGVFHEGTPKESYDMIVSL